jgi:hypothetical protein
VAVSLIRIPCDIEYAIFSAGVAAAGGIAAFTVKTVPGIRTKIEPAVRAAISLAEDM